MSTLERIFTGTAFAGDAARAAAALRELGLPAARDEEWRYANVRALDAIPDFRPAPPTSRAALRAAMPPGLALPQALPGFERLVYIDGQLQPDACTPTALEWLRGEAAGAAAYGGSGAADSVGTWNTPLLRLGLLNTLFASEPAHLALRGELSLELVHVAGAAGTAVYPQLQLITAAGSSVRLVERYLGGAERSLVCPAVDLKVQRAARLTHYRLQQCAPGTAFFDTLTATLEQDAAYTVRSVAVGAGTARTSAEIRLQGRGAALTWHGLAAGHDAQVLDGLLRITHSAPGTRTEEVFRGIAADGARVAFNGEVHIDATAPDSDARQSLRGLVDGTAAEIDLRPRLTINTDAVRATHGATTGRLDETLLFYLLSRGLPPATARTLLKWAFLGDVLGQIELPTLRRAAEQAAAGQLADIADVADALAISPAHASGASA
jgi:Fe-S cluster assembly protein SufD